MLFISLAATIFGKLIGTNMPESAFVSGTIVTHNTTPTIAAGKGFTVAKNGTARYRVTFNANIPRVIGCVGIYCNAGTARIMKKIPHVEGSNFVEFIFEDTSAVATEPGATDQFEFIAHVMMTKLPKV